MDYVPIFVLKEIWLFKYFCPDCLDKSTFLTELTKYGTKDFCIVHLLTYRDFPDGLQGYAYTGTICEYTSNTGFTTALNFNVSC